MIHPPNIPFTVFSAESGIHEWLQLSLSAEYCLGQCGVCRHHVICRFNGTLAKGTGRQLVDQIRKAERLHHKK